MKTKKINSSGLVLMLILAVGCAPKLPYSKSASKETPLSYSQGRDTQDVANIKWKDYFNDPYLITLIDTALKNNQELNMLLQEIEISRNEVRARKGEYLPSLNAVGGQGIEKAGRYTRNGAVEKNLQIKPGKEFPEPLQDHLLGVQFSWELDVWKKLRNAKQAAVWRYLSGIEGRNFMITQMVAEIADAYYELIALQKQLDILKQNIELQSSALRVIKLEKEAARVTQLAVNRFEAQLLHTENLQFDIQQQQVETENRINYLVGRFPQSISVDSTGFSNKASELIQAGIPSQLLDRRADIRQAEHLLEASKLDVQVARANFYPSFRISAGTGLQAFNPAYLFNPESIIFSLAGDMMAPLVNRNAIKATYYSANAKQIQAAYQYERTVLNAVIEVTNQMAKMTNYDKSYQTKQREVDILTQSSTISNQLFRSARADYMEVLLTQREALEAKMELVEIQLKQMKSRINIYRAAGGGWE
ncbi:MAG: efflux transporter outer membrane subunit [Chitinophagaceae bacterium]|nr:efflux transporter outer membrane subunit [Chitinophagaceae bacterium]